VALLNIRLSLLPAEYSIAAFRTTFWLEFSEKEQNIALFEQACNGLNIGVTSYAHNGENVNCYHVYLKQ
jgi:hypothetical protein